MDAMTSYIKRTALYYKLSFLQIKDLIEDLKNEDAETFDFQKHANEFFLKMRGRESL